MRRILLVEDAAADTDDHALVAPQLVGEGFEVMTIAAGAVTAEQWVESDPNLMVMDLMRPGPDVAEMCRWIRARWEVAIIVLAAWDDEDDLVSALAAGADDYLTRPFSVRELMARIGAVLRRSDQVGELLPEIMETGDVRIDLARHQLSVRGQRVTLPLLLFTLLTTLRRNQGRVISRDELADRLGPADAEKNPKAVTIYIRRLRTVIETDPARPRHLKTVGGRGYLFDP